MLRLAAALIAIAALLVAAQPAWAQRSAGSKITGSAYEYPYFFSSAGAYQDSAYQHATVLREATSYDEDVPQAVAQEHTAAIRQNLKSAGTKYDSLRKMAGGNKTVHKHLDMIAEHHKQVHSALDTIDGHVKSGSGDAAKVNDASHAAAQSLKAAQAEHEKLMQHFGQPKGK